MILHQADPPIIIHSVVIKHEAQDGLHCARNKPSLHLRHTDALKQKAARRRQLEGLQRYSWESP
jgi:hypothetical protein